MNLNDEEKQLLEQWLADQSFLNWAQQSDDRDVLKWEQYFNDHPNHWPIGKMAKEIALGVRFRTVEPEPMRAQEGLLKLLDRLDASAVPPKGAQQGPGMNYGPYLRVAAAIAILLVAGMAFLVRSLYNPEVILATNYGEQIEQQLEDGSKVVLNANSKLRFYAGNPRKVWLEGEAFFDIIRKPGTGEKFEVITKDLKVNVLGTSFNVNTRNDQTEVFLEEGKVELRIDDQSRDFIKMQSGDLVAYSKGQQRVNKKRSNVSSLERASWKEGALIFNNAPLPEALFDIEDIYGIQFVLASDGLREEVISGGVPIRNLNVTLQTLKQVYGIDITQKGKRYFLRKVAE